MANKINLHKYPESHLSQEWNLMEDNIKLLIERIKELQKERNNTPKHQVQVIESITEDINYYQNQIDFMVNEM